jgi:hypothetical protein
MFALVATKPITVSAILAETKSRVGAVGLSLTLAWSNIGLSVAPPLLGSMIDKIGWHPALRTFSCLSFVSVLFALLALNESRKATAALARQLPLDELAEGFALAADQSTALTSERVHLAVDTDNM